MSPEFEHQDFKPEDSQPEIKPANPVEDLYHTIESLPNVTDEKRAQFIHLYATDFANNHNRRIVAGQIKGPVLDPEEFEAKVTAEYAKLRQERGEK